MKSQEYFIDVINENDIVIGKALEEEVQRKNLLHHSVHFLILNSHHYLFCAHRVANRPIYGGWWTIPGAHVRSGENYDKTTTRFLSELQLQDDLHQLKQLKKIRVADGFENEWSMLYLLQSDSHPFLSSAKFQEGKFFSVPDVKKLCQTKNVTPYLLAALDFISLKK